MADYFDKRADFFRNYFEQGRAYSEYLATGTAVQQERWKNSEHGVIVTNDQQRVLSGFVRKIHCLVLSGIWCGDCARQGPIIHAIELAGPTIQCRFIESAAHQDLQDELRILGAKRVPAGVLLSEDFFEVARFGDRTLSVYRRKAATELGASCELGALPPAPGELSTETQEWVDFFERAHLLLRLSPMLRKRYND